MKMPMPIISAVFAQPIGVSFDARWIHAAQVAVVNGRARLIGAASVLRDEKAAGEPMRLLTREEVARLTRSLALCGVRSRKVVVAAPAQRAAVTTIELPPRSSGAPLEQIAEVELARLLRLDPGDFELALLEVPSAQNRGGRASTYIAATASHADGEALSAAFDGSGLSAVALTPESLAIAKAASLAGDSRAILSLNWSTLEVVVIDENAQVVYHRALPELGLHRVQTLAKERLNLGPAAFDGVVDALVNGHRTPNGDPLEGPLQERAEGVSRLLAEHADMMAVEVERSLAYAARFSPECEQKPVRIVGDCGGMPGLAERLGSQISLGVTPLVCRELVEVPASLARYASSPGLLAAIGASMWVQAAPERKVA